LLKKTISKILEIKNKKKNIFISILLSVINKNTNKNYCYKKNRLINIYAS